MQFLKQGLRVTSGVSMTRHQRLGPLLFVALLVGACSSDGAGAGSGSVDGSPGGEGANSNDTSGGGDVTDPDDPGVTDPGRVTIHRLNRVEYNNTVRDLLGTALSPADDFPADDIGHGFDNNADVLSLSPLQLELYERAAEVLIEDTLAIPRAAPDVLQFEAEEMTASVGASYRDQGWNLWSNGTLETIFTADDGEYRLSARAFGHQAGDEPAQMAINLDGRVLAVIDVEATEGAPAVYSVEAEVEAGEHVFSVEFINDFYLPEEDADRNLIVDWMRIEGPLNLPPADTTRRDRVLTCAPEAGAEEVCARAVVQGFARRAWRRPVTDAEVDQLMPLFQLGMEESADFEEAIRLPLQAVLLSPNFVFRVELDPDPNAESAHALSDHELATRLSYFMWSSMPDDELMTLADEGRLNTDEELRRQVSRMLADPRSRALVENFAGQWLYTRAMEDVQPDYNVFPEFDDELREAMRLETELFFEEFLYTDRSVEEMLTARFSYINDRLARHYGMDARPGDGFERVELTGPRHGLLGQGSVLTVTSYPTRTSPVKRGKWILTQLLCTEPEAPPPGVEGLAEPEMPTGTLRERLEQHRADPICASCHDSMDPLGFGLENFDAVGAYRLQDIHGFDIDASGELPDGSSFTDASGMASIIAEDPNFARCVTWQMYTYALGRGIEGVDTLHLRAIRAAFEDGDHTLHALIEAIVLSPSFRMRRGETPDEQPAPTEEGP
ncbi:MAG: hypothetical protein CMH57_14360 [Myxococcales bacterium]|nr:hypothetical protein [Myxococcales bacterium]